MPKLIDLTGKKFGRLVVIEFVGRNKRRQSKWLCLCDCGQKSIIFGYHLKDDSTKSCGCLRKEVVSKRMITHGNDKKGKRTKAYRSWSQIIQRCTNFSHPRYKDYGGREIEVCKRWLKFENFLEDMGQSLGDGYSIERKDNNGDYCKENCKWATSKQQNRNKRNNRLETFHGETKCISDLSEKYNIPYKTLWSRLYMYGWSIEKALITPVKRYGKRGK